jgi:hypothetical protein
MTDHVAGPPPALRAAIARDLAPVRPLASPVARVAAMIPVAIVLLLAAPLVFSFRDLDALGLAWSWGASVLQVMAGLALTVAALRESVPGRTWSSLALWLMAAAAVGIVVGTTLASWQLSPVAIRGAALIVGAMCMASSAITALPATLLAVVLAMRAYPMRPVVTGWLAGLGGGLMADAGWRLFCHFSEPAHVLAAHLGGVVAAGAIGALAARRLAR